MENKLLFKSANMKMTVDVMEKEKTSLGQTMNDILS